MSTCVSPEGKSLSSHRHGTNLKKMTLKNSALLRYISLTAGRALRALKEGLSGEGVAVFSTVETGRGKYYQGQRKGNTLIEKYPHGLRSNTCD